MELPYCSSVHLELTCDTSAQLLLVVDRFAENPSLQTGLRVFSENIRSRMYTANKWLLGHYNIFKFSIYEITACLALNICRCALLCWSQAHVNWDGCIRKGIQHKILGSLSIRSLSVCHYCNCLLEYQLVDLQKVSARWEGEQYLLKYRTADWSGAGSPGLTCRKGCKTSLLLLPYGIVLCCYSACRW